MEICYLTAGHPERDRATLLVGSRLYLLHTTLTKQESIKEDEPMSTTEQPQLRS